tara:strand:+ start:83 stop:328 length:246 start_codon:yes stop_codon:yes gene_type:complete
MKDLNTNEDTYQEVVYKYGVYEQIKLQPNETRTPRWSLTYSTVTLEQAQQLKLEEELERGDLWEYKIVDHGDSKTITRGAW